MRGRAAAAAIYPHRLCCAICKGLAAQIAENKNGNTISVAMGKVELIEMKSRATSLGMVCQQASGRKSVEEMIELYSIQMEVDGDEVPTGRFRRTRPNDPVVPNGEWPENWVDTVHEMDGHSIGADGGDRTGEEFLKREIYSLYCQAGIEYAEDDVSGAVLDPEAVRLGRSVEMKYFEDMKVYDRVPRSEQAQTGGKIVGTKWIDVNNGDIENPNIRCRLVGKEFKTTPDDALYASTPPLEALRMILSRAATIDAGGEQREIMVNDVSRAYFYAKCTRCMYIELPEEDPEYGTGKVGKIRLCLYGTRDAAQNWEEEYIGFMKEIGFDSGRASPCLFHHKDRVRCSTSLRLSEHTLEPSTLEIPTP